MINLYNFDLNSICIIKYIGIIYYFILKMK